MSRHFAQQTDKITLMKWANYNQSFLFVCTQNLAVWCAKYFLNSVKAVLFSCSLKVCQKINFTFVCIHLQSMESNDLHVLHFFCSLMKETSYLYVISDGHLFVIDLLSLHYVIIYFCLIVYFSISFLFVCCKFNYRLYFLQSEVY